MEQAGFAKWKRLHQAGGPRVGDAIPDGAAQVESPHPIKEIGAKS
jgi:hypothetical protein